MKRFSLMAIVTAISLLGALVIGASSASATSLCKEEAVEHQCETGDAYTEGTEIHAELAPETNAVVYSKSGSMLNYCEGAEIDMTVSDVEAPEDGVDATLDEYSLSGCKYPITMLPSMDLAHFRWTPGTHAGIVYINKRAEVAISWGVKCRYTLWGPAQVVPGATPQIVFDESSEWILGGGHNSFLCPARVRFMATYNITTPTPLYVEEN